MIVKLPSILLQIALSSLFLVCTKILRPTSTAIDFQAECKYQTDIFVAAYPSKYCGASHISEFNPREHWKECDSKMFEAFYKPNAIRVNVVKSCRVSANMLSYTSLFAQA